MLATKGAHYQGSVICVQTKRFKVGSQQAAISSSEEEKEGHGSLAVTYVSSGTAVSLRNIRQNDYCRNYTVCHCKKVILAMFKLYEDSFYSKMS